MPEDTKPQPISPKVHVGAASGGLGGSSAAVLLIWIMQAAGIPEAQFTPERVAALAGLCAWIGVYIGGYYKSE